MTTLGELNGAKVYALFSKSQLMINVKEQDSAYVHTLKMMKMFPCDEEMLSSTIDVLDDEYEQVRDGIIQYLYSYQPSMACEGR